MLPASPHSTALHMTIYPVRKAAVTNVGYTRILDFKEDKDHKDYKDTKEKDMVKAMSFSC